MKIAITAGTRQIESPVDFRFGRCAYFIMTDLETGAFHAVENPGNSTSGGAGVHAAQFLVDQQVNAVITGQVGPNAMPVLIEGNVAVYKSDSCSIKEAVERFKANSLQRLTAASVSSHSGLK